MKGCKCRIEEEEAEESYPITLRESFRKFRIREFSNISTWKWYGCQPNAQAVFTPRKDYCYSFLLEAESTPILRPEGLSH
jgi:hypothetical protein